MISSSPRSPNPAPKKTSAQPAWLLHNEDFKAFKIIPAKAAAIPAKKRTYHKTT